MNKFVSVILCLCLVASVSIFALAEDEELYYSQETVDDLQSRINDLTDENESLHIQVDEMQENMDSLTATNTELRTQVDDLQDDNDSLKSDNDNLTGQLSAIQSAPLSVQSADDTSATSALNDPEERTDGLVKVVEDVLGQYSPRTETITTSDSEGNQTESTAIVSGVAGMDWNWIASAVLFAVMLYGIMRIIGGVLSWN